MGVMADDDRDSGDWLDVETVDPAVLLDRFLDTNKVALLLGKSRQTVGDMADRGVLTRYRVGAAVLYYGPQVLDVRDALQRLRVRAAVPVPADAGRAL
jgi:hypothetical protein